MNFKSFLSENKKDYASLLEGAMSDIHQLANDSKDIESFTKDFFKQFGAKIKKTSDSVGWVESLYDEMTNEAYDGNMADFKYEFPTKFEEATGNNTKAIKKIAKKGKAGYEVRTSTYMSEPEMKLVADAMGMELKSYLKSTNVAISVFESLINEAKFDKKKLMKAMKADDGIIQLANGEEYLIYAYDNGNDENDAMWNDKSIFALDQDGGEHEINYSDIVSYNESAINERDIVRLGKLDDASMVHKILKDEMIKNKISRTRSGDGEVTVYTNDIPNLKKLMDDLGISYELYESVINENDYDEVAQAEFGMDYDQLGKGEKEWVRDEIENNESVVTENSVTFTLDDGDLDDKFLSDKSLSRNLDYKEDGRDTYYVLPKRDFDRLQDWADSSGYDTDEVIEVIEESVITEANGQTVKEFGDLLALLLDEDSGLDIERAIIAMAPNKARVLEKQISTLYKKLFDLTNQGFDLREVTESKIQIKRRYTDNHPAQTSGRKATVRNAMIEALADGILTEEEFNNILKEKSIDNKRWMRRNSKYFKVSEGGIGLSKFGKRILTGIKPVVSLTLESFISEITESVVNEANFIKFKGKKVDISSLEMEDVDMKDYPDFSDAYFSYGEYSNGKEMTDEELSDFTDDNGDLANELAHDSLH